MKIYLRDSELADREIWHFPLTLLVVLATLSHYRVRCDSSKTVKATDLTFDVLVNRDSADMTPTTFIKGGMESVT